MANTRRSSEIERAQALGMRLRQLRRASKLRLEQVAQQVPMSDANLSRIENGRQGPPPDDTIEKLATILQADPLELLQLAGRVITTSTLDTLQKELNELRQTIEHGLAQLNQQASTNATTLERIERSLERSSS